jgi:DNA-binding NarL/FixJ family response regulator
MSVQAGFTGVNQSPTVVVADASRFGCQLLADAIRSHKDFRVVGSATTRLEVISDISKFQPDIAVISSRLEDGALTGLQVLRELRTFQTSPRVIMLLDDDQSELVIESFRNGARGIFCRAEMPPNYASVSSVCTRARSGLTTASWRALSTRSCGCPRHCG